MVVVIRTAITGIMIIRFIRPLVLNGTDAFACIRCNGKLNQIIVVASRCLAISIKGNHIACNLDLSYTTT